MAVPHLSPRSRSLFRWRRSPASHVQAGCGICGMPPVSGGRAARPAPGGTGCRASGRPLPGGSSPYGPTPPAPRRSPSVRPCAAIRSISRSRRVSTPVTGSSVAPPVSPSWERASWASRAAAPVRRRVRPPPARPAPGPARAGRRRGAARPPPAARLPPVGPGPDAGEPGLGQRRPGWAARAGRRAEPRPGVSPSGRRRRGAERGAGRAGLAATAAACWASSLAAVVRPCAPATAAAAEPARPGSTRPRPAGRPPAAGRLVRPARLGQHDHQPGGRLDRNRPSPTRCCTYASRSAATAAASRRPGAGGRPQAVARPVPARPGRRTPAWSATAGTRRP